MKTNQLLVIACITTLSFGVACDTKEKKMEDTVVSATDTTMPAVNSAEKSTTETVVNNSGESNAVDTTTTKLEKTVSITRKKYQSKINFIPYQPDVTMKIEADRYGVYNRAEIMPSFPGGQEALKKYIQNNVQYPDEALEKGIEGTVLLAFIVDEAGKIYTPSIESPSIGSGLEQESVRLIRQMPKWNPGQIKGRNVKTKFTLPIKYEIF